MPRAGRDHRWRGVATLSGAPHGSATGGLTRANNSAATRAAAAAAAAAAIAVGLQPVPSRGSTPPARPVARGAPEIMAVLALWLQQVAWLGSVRAARRCRKTTMASESVHAACARTRVSAVRRCHRHPAHHRLLAHGVVVQLRSSRHPLCCASASPDRRRAGGRRSFWPARARSQGGMEERRPGGAPPLARALLDDTGYPCWRERWSLYHAEASKGRGLNSQLCLACLPHLSRVDL